VRSQLVMKDPQRETKEKEREPRGSGPRLGFAPWGRFSIYQPGLRQGAQSPGWNHERSIRKRKMHLLLVWPRRKVTGYSTRSMTKSNKQDSETQIGRGTKGGKKGCFEKTRISRCRIDGNAAVMKRPPSPNDNCSGPVGLSRTLDPYLDCTRGLPCERCGLAVRQSYPELVSRAVQLLRDGFLTRPLERRATAFSGRLAGLSDARCRRGTKTGISRLRCH
jgi:hypothetical protein